MAELFPYTRQDPRSRTRRRQRLDTSASRLALSTDLVADGVVVVAVDGEIDLANKDALAEALATVAADPGLRLLVCDLTTVSFLACAGVSVLVDTAAELDGRGALLRVVATDPTVLRVLDATGQRGPLGVRPHLSAALFGFVRAATAPGLADLRTKLDAAVAQTTSLAELCGRLAAEVAAVEAERLVDQRGDHWRPDDTLADMAEDLRVLQKHLATGALLAAPTVEDLGHLRDQST